MCCGPMARVVTCPGCRLLWPHCLIQSQLTEGKAWVHVSAKTSQTIINCCDSGRGNGDHTCSLNVRMCVQREIGGMFLPKYDIKHLSTCMCELILGEETKTHMWFGCSIQRKLGALGHSVSRYAGAIEGKMVVWTKGCSWAHLVSKVS